jgi:hypothetical protein
MLRAVATAVEERTDLDMAVASARRPVRLMLDEHSTGFRVLGQVPAVSVRAGVKLSTNKGHALSLGCPPAKQVPDGKRRRGDPGSRSPLAADRNLMTQRGGRFLAELVLAA